MSCDEVIVTSREHNLGIMLDERKGMAIEVPEHGVAAPTAKDPDLVRINASKEEGHGAARSEGPGCNIFRIDPSIARYCECGCMQETGDHGAG